MGPSDLFLSPDLTEEQARRYLQSLGFRDAAAVDVYLQQMADDLVVREALGRIAPDLIPALLESPDPDAAAANLAHYVQARTGRAMLIDYLREDPRALHVLTYVMGASPPLSEILIRTPEYFHWLVSQVERSAPDRQDHEEELVSAFAAVDDPVEGLNLLRRWKRREVLRVGTRDLLRHETVQTAAAQLSDIAAVAIDFALAIVMHQRLEADGWDRPPGSFAVIATRRLGARELGYGPDVDLLYVYDAPDAAQSGGRSVDDFFVRVGSDLSAALAAETHEGLLYRVGLPGWPRSEGHPRACPLGAYDEHYRASRDLAEHLALTRARPIAGDAGLGARFLAASESAIYGRGVDRAGLEPALAASGGDDIEWLTQALQLAHGGDHAPLRGAGTLDALAAAAGAGLMPADLCRELDHAYVFLRTSEHRRELGVDAGVPKQVEASRARVREICIGRLAEWEAGGLRPDGTPD